MHMPTRFAAIMMLALAPLLRAAAADTSGGIPVEIVRKVDPSVVAIKHEKAQGSGFIVSADGYILTNGHVVRAEDPEDPTLPAESITVVLSDDRKYPARVIGFWMDPDVALIKITPDGALTPVEYADSRSARTGQRCFAVGNPVGLKRTYTSGLLSNVERTDLGTETKVLQTDAAINPGNSGGPLFDLEGRVLGINTYGIQGGNNLGFTIPIHVVLAVKDSLLKHGRFVRSEVNLAVFGEVSDELAAGLGIAHGVLVHHVEPGSPAAQAGLCAGDVVVALDGQPCAARNRAQALDFDWELTISPPGRKLRLSVARLGQAGTREVEVVLQEACPMPAYARHSGELRELRVDALGFGATELVEMHRYIHNLGPAAGVLVSSLAKESAAAKAGLRQNDILTAVGGRPVDSLKSFREALSAALAARGAAFEVGVVRGRLRFDTALAPDYPLKEKRALILVADPAWSHLPVLQLELAAEGCAVETQSLAALDAAKLAAGAPDVLLLGGDGDFPAALPEAAAKVAVAVRAARATLAATGAASPLLVKAVPELAGKKMTCARSAANALSALGATYTGMDVESGENLVTSTAADRKITRKFIRSVIQAMQGGGHAAPAAGG